MTKRFLMTAMLLSSLSVFGMEDKGTQKLKEAVLRAAQDQGRTYCFTGNTKKFRGEELPKHVSDAVRAAIKTGKVKNKDQFFVGYYRLSDNSVNVVSYPSREQAMQNSSIATAESFSHLKFTVEK